MIKINLILIRNDSKVNAETNEYFADSLTLIAMSYSS